VPVIVYKNYFGCHGGVFSESLDLVTVFYCHPGGR
jgi:hypothetical protein